MTVDSTGRLHECNTGECGECHTCRSKGFVVASYHKSGGCAATWKPTLETVFDFLKDMQSHDSIAIVPCNQNDIHHRYVVNQAIGSKDSGISTPLKKSKADPRIVQSKEVRF